MRWIGAALATLPMFCALGAAAQSPLPSDGETALEGFTPPLEQALEVEQQLRAQLISRHRTLLSSEIPGRIARIPRREGESFNEGDALVELDCAMHEAQLGKAEAQLEEARAVHQVNTDLDEFRSVSTLELRVSAARQVAAEAEVGLARVMVERCTLAAPFSGKVVELHVEPHAYVAEGQELLVILDHRSLGVELIVPSRWLSWLEPGATFDLHVDEVDATYPAEVERIVPQVNPVSQSVKVFGSLQQQHPELVSGMSGVARFERPERKRNE